MTIDRKQIKVQTFSQDINDVLKNGCGDIVFQGKGSVIQARFSNNQDGTSNVVYIVKPEIVDVRLLETNISIVDDKKIKEKSRALALRHRCLAIGTEIGEDGDKLYEEVMDYANEKLDLIRDERML